MLNSAELLNLIEQKKYSIEVHKHKPLFSVEDSKNLRGKVLGMHSKNLFLKNKKDNFFLISCEESENIDLKELSKSLELGNISFAKEKYLDQYLGIRPGSVSPLALLNDIENRVNFYLEKKLYESQIVNFHPLINTLTITIETNMFIKFMIENKKKIHIFSSDQGKILKTYGQ